MKIALNVISVFAVVTAMLVSACGKSDVDIQRTIHDKLNGGGIIGVTVFVQERVVTLSGEVDDEATKEKAEGLAKSVEGVDSIVNNLTLKPQTLSATDQELKSKIEKNWKNAGCDGATVEVKHGVATVGGSVPDEKYAQCLLILSQSGATQQVNNLRKEK